MEQQYSSADTSINVVNKIYTHYSFRENSHILDYGGGKYESNVKYMREKNVCVEVYDKYNRTAAHNSAVKARMMKCQPEYIVCSNVLNVIKEDEIIDDILADIWQYAKKAIVLFSVYTGNNSGVGKPTKKGYQRNEQLSEYIPKVEKYFTIAKVKGGIIECRRKESK